MDTASQVILESGDPVGPDVVPEATDPPGAHVTRTDAEKSFFDFAFPLGCLPQPSSLHPLPLPPLLHWPSAGQLYTTYLNNHLASLLSPLFSSIPPFTHLHNAPPDT